MKRDRDYHKEERGMSRERIAYYIRDMARDLMRVANAILDGDEASGRDLVPFIRKLYVAYRALDGLPEEEAQKLFSNPHRVRGEVVP